MEKQLYTVNKYTTFKGTSKQIEEIKWMLEEEDWTNPRFTKYFHVWVYEGLGVFFFPREAYYGGEENYVVALMRYGALTGEKYRSVTSKAK